MKTERAFIVEDKEALPSVYVGHIFRPSDDSRRHTNFYSCLNQKAAEQLAEALNLSE